MKLTKQQSVKLLDFLWDSMKRDPEHNDRRKTGWGTKTEAGLVACIERIVSELDSERVEEFAREGTHATCNLAITPPSSPRGEWIVYCQTCKQTLADKRWNPEAQS